MRFSIATSHGVVAVAPDPSECALSNPSLLALGGGNWLTSVEVYTTSRSVPERYYSSILFSIDSGRSWRPVAKLKAKHGRLFRARELIYYIGHDNDLVISVSRDRGMTWEPPVKLTDGQVWHQSASNVWYCGDYVYLAMDKITGGIPDTWQVPWIAPVLLRAMQKDDLTKKESWEFSRELAFCDVLQGYKQNQLSLDYFGVPFFQQNYPFRNHLVSGRYMQPMGWLEANVIQIKDRNHYWYDPEERTFHLFMRSHTGMAGYAAMLKVVEHRNGRMSVTLESAPSGRKILFLPMPGGHLRFHVLYDEESRRYWLLGSQSTDSMARLESLGSETYGLACNERHRLVLHFSTNMVDWCFAGVVDIGRRREEMRCYASMAFDCDDIVIVARSGSEDNRSARDGDIITMHRVKDFRALIY